MKRFLQLLRGTIGTGITWAIGWGAAFLGLHVGFGFGNFGGLAVAAVAGMVFGFIGGGSFALILSMAERGNRLDQFSLKRVALWGGIGGAAIALLAAPSLIKTGIPLDVLVTGYLTPLGIMGLLGAGFASGSVALARRADTKLLQGGDELLPALEGE